MESEAANAWGVHGMHGEERQQARFGGVARWTCRGAGVQGRGVGAARYEIGSRANYSMGADLSSEAKKAHRSTSTEMSESYHSRGMGERPFSRAELMRSAVSTGRSAAISVETSTSERPYAVTC